MNPTAEYLDSFAKTTADVRIATIEVRNDDDTYDVRYIDTRSLDRAAKANPVDEFALGSRVLVQMPSNSRTVVGALPVILSRAPREQRGLSGTTPAESDDRYSKAIVTGVDPDPLILERGGDPGEQVILGVSLSEAASYLSRTGDDPVLVEEDAPVITGSKVTMSFAADADCPLGDFDIDINGVKVSKALRVVENSRVIGPYLYVTTVVNAPSFTGIPTLRKVNVPDFGLLASFSGTVNGSPIGGTVAQLGEVVAWVHGENEQPANVRRIDVATDAVIADDTIATSQILDQLKLALVGDGSFYMAGDGLWLVGESSAAQVWVAGANYRAVTLAGADVVIGGQTSSTIKRFDVATYTQQATAFGASAEKIIVIGSDVWVASNSGTGTVQKRNLSDLALTLTIVLGGQPGDMLLVGGMLYVNRCLTGLIMTVNPATGVAADLVNVGVKLAPGMTTDGTHLYVIGESDLCVRKIVAATGTIVATSARISPTAVDDEYAQQIHFVTL